MTENEINIEQMLRDEWTELGFYYDLDQRLEVNQWRFYGSKKGYQHFITLLDEYTNDTNKEGLSEHEHYGPYSYLKIITCSKATITDKYIAGTIQDLKN